MAGKRLKIAIIVIVVLLALPWVILIVAAPFNLRTASETDFSKSALKAQPPKPLTKPMNLKMVTFNVHDMYVLSGERTERMQGIAQAVRELEADLVGLQETWIEKDRQTIVDAVAGSKLAYHQYFPSGFSGSGLFVLSAYPIKEGFFHRYQRNGKWYKPYHGDWWGGKGVALVRVELPGGEGYIDFYDTHAHASYGSDEYDGDREAQMQEAAEFIKATATGTAPAFFVGDFNCRAGSKAFEIAVNQANLQWLMTGNPRIDNIFGVKNPHYAFEVIESVPIDRKINVHGKETRLSDHNGYCSTIRITPAAG